MELHELNSILSDLDSIDSKKLQFIERKDISTPIGPDDDGYQGEENVFERVYKIVGSNDLYLKIIYYTDSYGSGEYIRGVQFVKPQQKTVTVFETI